MKFPRKLSFGFDRFSGLYIWALFIIVFSIWKPSLFPTAATLHSVAADQAITALVALALLIPLATGVYDLSVGATANLSAIVAVQLQTGSQHLPWVPAAIIAVVVCVLVGVINGFIVVRLRVNSFIATLGMATVIGAVQTIVSGNSLPAFPTSTAWNNLTQTNVAGFQIVVVYLIVIAIVLWWVLEWTPAGRHLYAVGDNSEAARLSGIRSDRWAWRSLIASGFISGIAGVLYSSLSGPSLTFGTSLLLPAFAAVFLGSTQLKPGKFNVWGTLIGVYALATGIQGLEFVTNAQWLSGMFDGVALIVAVSFAVWRQRATGLSKAVSAIRGRRDVVEETDPVEPPALEYAPSTALDERSEDA
jgi:ribose transport system permease protein